MAAKNKVRLVHTREVEGSILISDIDQGLPEESMDEERKQDVYVTHDKLDFEFSGTTGTIASVSRNADLPGYIDLVPSDKVILSRDKGVIAGLSEQGLIEVVDLPSGGIQDPVITEAAQTGTGDVVITGTSLDSFSPDITRVILDDGDGGLLEFQEGDDDTTFGATSITIEEAAHGSTEYAGTGSQVTVIANREEDTLDIDHTPA